MSAARSKQGAWIELLSACLDICNCTKLRERTEDQRMLMRFAKSQLTLRSGLERKRNKVVNALGRLKIEQRTKLSSIDLFSHRLDIVC